MRRLFEIDAELGLAALWHGVEVTAIDGTTLELGLSDALACEFGSSSEASRPLLRIAGLVGTASRRWIAAEAGACHQGENELAGADLVWRWKNDSKSLPAKTLQVLPGGSELVVLRPARGTRRPGRRKYGTTGR